MLLHVRGCHLLPARLARLERVEFLIVLFDLAARDWLIALGTEHDVAGAVEGVHPVVGHGDVALAAIKKGIWSWCNNRDKFLFAILYSLSCLWEYAYSKNRNRVGLVKQPERNNCYIFHTPFAGIIQIRFLGYFSA